MALQVADGTITLSTGAVGTTFTVSGLAFQPVAIFFFWNGRATSGQGEADHKFGAGFAVSTSSRRAFTTQSDHGNTTIASDTARYNDCCVATLTIAGAIDGKADLNAINSDGFQLIIDDVFSAGLQVGWIAWGGSDLTNAEIVDISEPGATGNQDIATSFALNTGADDKAIIFLGSSDGAYGTPTTFSTFMFGVAAGDTPVNAVFAACSDDALGTSNTMAYSRTGDCIAEVDSDVVHSRAAVSAWLSTGFRLNWSAVDAATTWPFSALVMKGGRWQVGDSVTSTGTTNQTENTNYQPKGIVVGSACRAASTAGTSTAVDERSIGVATSASSRRCASLTDKDAATIADMGIDYREDAFYSNQSTATTVVVEGLADLVSFDAAPSFTFVMDDADPTANYFFYLLAADAPGGGGGPVLNDHNFRRVGRGAGMGVSRGGW